MKFSYNFLQSFFKKKLPPAEKLAEKLMMHFFEVEEIEHLKDDIVFDIDVLPNRAADCFSHVGVAREIAAIIGMEYEKPKADFQEDSESISDLINIKVKNACSRYTLRAMKGVKVKPSLPYIQKRLKSCGIKPINNIVDATNYVMLEMGQPLHAFDGGKIGGEDIVVRFAKKREKIVTLDEKRYELYDDILVIADEFSPLGIAGIKGGIVPEVDKNTNLIFIEAGNFDAKTVRKGSQKLKLRTDASSRFEHGIPPEFTKEALDRVVTLIAKNGGGKILKGALDYYPNENKAKEIIFLAQEVRGLLGVEIPLKEIERILRSLEFKVRREGDTFYAEVPYFRIDISIKEDVIEEVGRIYGYENIKPVMPTVQMRLSKESASVKMEKIFRNLWSAIGFSEAYNYSFINNKVATSFEYKNLIEVEKPVSLEYKYLRPSLLPGLLENIKENEKNFKEIKIFELGRVFFYDDVAKEKKMISGVMAPDNFYEMKGALDVFFEKINIEDISYFPVQDENFLNLNRSAKIISGDVVIGYVGEISSEIRGKINLKKKVSVFEIDFEKIVEIASEIKPYDQISRFPFMIRDLAVLVPEKTLHDEVLKEIKNAGGILLRNIDLFDVYKGESIPEGQKNFAFRLFFQAKNKTLSPEEANRLQEKVIKALDSKPEWKVRK